MKNRTVVHRTVLWPGLKFSAVCPAARILRQTEDDFLRRRFAALAGKALPKRPGGGAGIVPPHGNCGADFLAYRIHGRSLALGNLPQRVFGNTKFFAVHPSSS